MVGIYCNKGNMAIRSELQQILLYGNGYEYREIMTKKLRLSQTSTTFPLSPELEQIVLVTLFFDPSYATTVSPIQRRVSLSKLLIDGEATSSLRGNESLRRPYPAPSKLPSYIMLTSKRVSQTKPETSRPSLNRNNTMISSET